MLIRPLTILAALSLLLVSAPSAKGQLTWAIKPSQPLNIAVRVHPLSDDHLSEEEARRLTLGTFADHLGDAGVVAEITQRSNVTPGLECWIRVIPISESGPIMVMASPLLVERVDLPRTTPREADLVRISLTAGTSYFGRWDPSSMAPSDLSSMYARGVDSCAASFLDSDYWDPTG